MGIDKGNFELTVRGESFNLIGFFVDLPFYWRELVRDFGRNVGRLAPLGFLANPQLSTGLVCLYQLPFELD